MARSQIGKPCERNREEDKNGCGSPLHSKHERPSHLERPLKVTGFPLPPPRPPIPNGMAAALADLPRLLVVLLLLNVLAGFVQVLLEFLPLFFREGTVRLHLPFFGPNLSLFLHQPLGFLFGQFAGLYPLLDPLLLSMLPPIDAAGLLVRKHRCRKGHNQYPYDDCPYDHNKLLSARSELVPPNRADAAWRRSYVSYPTRLRASVKKTFISC